MSIFPGIIPPDDEPSDGSLGPPKPIHKPPEPPFEPKVPPNFPEMTFSPFLAKRDFPKYGVKKGNIYWISDQTAGSDSYFRILGQRFLANRAITKRGVKPGRIYLVYSCSAAAECGCQEFFACCTLPDGSKVDGLSEVDCLDAGGTWVDEHCPSLALQPCCFTTTIPIYCSALTYDECIYLGGNPLSANLTCADCPVDEVEGICCTNMLCEVLTQNDCIGQGGEWFGPDADCSVCTPPPNTGACCTPAPDCGCIPDQTEEECNTIGGQWLGVGSDCATCFSDNGTCCFFDGCIGITCEGCVSLGGDWLGILNEANPCDPDPCTAGQGVGSARRIQLHKEARNGL